MKQRRERRATIYRRENGIFVAGAQEVDDGLCVHGPPYLQLPRHATADEVGAAVARALAENRYGAVMADAEVYARTWQPLLALAGTHTNSEFHTGLSAVEVEVSGSRCRVTELENRGSGGEFVAIEPPLVVQAGSPDEPDARSPATSTLAPSVETERTLPSNGMPERSPSSSPTSRPC